MKERRFYNRSATCVIGVMMLGLTLISQAQEIHMPDAELRKLVRETLNLPANTRLTKQHMLQLESIDAGGNRGITDLTGLEHATNIGFVSLYHNPISDISAFASLEQMWGFNLWGCQIENISPLKNLTNLSGFSLGANQISDLRPLSGLIQLRHIELESNRISDVSPLTSLINLKVLELDHNQIVDFNPLANLINLDKLWINDNLGTDFTPLQGLTLSEFKYDEVCDIAPVLPSVTERINNRNYPSVVQAWNDVVGLDHLTWHQRNELHDLHFSQTLGLNWDTTREKPTHGLATLFTGNIQEATTLKMRKNQSNPDMIILVSFNIHQYWSIDALPPNSDMWLKDSNGNIVQNIFGEHMVDFLKPEVQKLLAEKMLGVEKCGVFDGIFIDGFGNNAVGFVGRDLYVASDEDIIQATTNILRMVREQARDDFLILVNSGEGLPPNRYSEYVNGNFMETFKTGPEGYSLDHIMVLEDILSWSEDNLREPQINCLEIQGMSIEPPDGPNNRRFMRMFTTLTLTHSNGYVLYTDGMRDFVTHEEPFLFPHHGHIWHSFWDTDLGQPLGPKKALYDDTPGLFIREFTNGWAVYNRSGKAPQIEFPEKVSSVTSGLTVANHAVLDLDGDIFLKVETKNPADVNADGIVNILDLILVAQGIGTGELTADVNGDGVVNVFDLVFVANQF